ncbi:hypothetical protein [Anoxybacteroides amylolyticum]|uniref:Uncharacterized protein n=1 Tax=Anoxybacteroides amylolyticum TaxID=294699 RepID=A0A160F107_9BACL|nr:hypothetical protein [Anoxybacillus amylolyticus]ANB59768.1 hypothetical protein GFC30_467 [Anoxybacillus amylolyticus]
MNIVSLRLVPEGSVLRRIYIHATGEFNLFFDCRRQAKGLPLSRVRVTENRITSPLPDNFICLGAVLFGRPTVEKC